MLNFPPKMADIKYIDEARVFHASTLRGALNLSHEKFDVVYIDLNVFFRDTNGRGMNYLNYHDPVLAKSRLVGKVDDETYAFAKKIRAELAVNLVRTGLIPRPPIGLTDDKDALMDWLVEKVPFYTFDEVLDTLPPNSVLFTAELAERGMLLSKSETISYVKIGQDPEPKNNLKLYALRDFYDESFVEFMSTDYDRLPRGVYPKEDLYHYAFTLSKAIDLAGRLSSYNSDYRKIVLDIGDVIDLRSEETPDGTRWSYRIRGESGYRKVDVTTDTELMVLGQEDEDGGIIVTNNLKRAVEYVHKTFNPDYLEEVKLGGLPLIVAFGSNVSGVDQVHDKHMSVPLIQAVLLKDYESQIYPE